MLITLSAKRYLIGFQGERTMGIKNKSRLVAVFFILIMCSSMSLAPFKIESAAANTTTPEAATPPGAGPTIVHAGDISLNGTNSMTISDCTYIQTGNIILRNNSLLVITNSQLILNQTRSALYSIQALDNSTLSSLNATISSNYTYSQTFSGTSKINFTQTTWMNMSSTSYTSSKQLTVTNSVIDGANSPSIVGGF